MTKTGLIAASLAVCGAAGAQSTRIAWIRTSSSTDLTMDVARDGILNANDQYVFVGSSLQPDGSRKGNITILGPNRTLINSVDIPAPSAGGSLEFTHILQRDGFYIAVGQAIEPGTTDGKLYVTKLDANLGVVGESLSAVNPDGGFEETTDVAIDDLGRIYTSVIARKGNNYAASLHVHNFALNSTTALAEVAVTNYTRPQVTLNGLNSILMGLVSDRGLTLNSYSPTGTQNFSWSADETYGSYGYSFALTDMFGDSCAIAGNRNLVVGEGVMESRGDIFRVNVNTGVQEGMSSLPNRAGGDSVIPITGALGPTIGKQVNVLFNYGARTYVRSLNADFTVADDFVNPQIFWPGSMFVDSYGEVEVSGIRPLGQNLYRGIKLNANNDLRYAWGMELAPPAIWIPDLEQSNVQRAKSGDFVDIYCDGRTMQLICIQQAPIAITDGVFRPQSGKIFRPASPVTVNDRYASGAAITITQAPAHGILTMGADGYFNYTSTPGYRGTDSFKYTLTKAGLNTSTATVNMSVQ